MPQHCFGFIEFLHLLVVLDIHSQFTFRVEFIASSRLGVQC